MIKIFKLFLFIALNCAATAQIKLPVASYDRTDIYSIELTEIGTFGKIRKARPKVPAHLHTGVDIKRPSKNYFDEPIFPIYEGTVISKRDDGPYAQLIIEHIINDNICWSVYEHIAGIRCSVGEYVSTEEPIARFMTTKELNTYGWQFNHVHLEIMKQPPIQSKPTDKLPERFYSTYWLSCFTKEELDYFYYDPLEFINGYYFE